MIVDSFRFLGVLVDSHLTFKHHVQDITKKAKKRIYLLIKLKRTGVSMEKLKLFYLSNVRSVMTYAAPSFYSMLNGKQVESLESIQRLSTKIICPDIESYSERLNILKIPVLSNFIEGICCKYFNKICNCDTILRDIIPQRREESGLRYSKRLKNNFVTIKTQTKLRKNFYRETFSFKLICDC